MALPPKKQVSGGKRRSTAAEHAAVEKAERKPRPPEGQREAKSSTHEDTSRAAEWGLIWWVLCSLFDPTREASHSQRKGRRRECLPGDGASGYEAPEFRVDSADPCSPDAAAHTRRPSRKSCNGLRPRRELP